MVKKYVVERRERCKRPKKPDKTQSLSSITIRWLGKQIFLYLAADDLISDVDRSRWFSFDAQCLFPDRRQRMRKPSAVFI